MQSHPRNNLDFDPCSDTHLMGKNLGDGAWSGIDRPWEPPWSTGVWVRPSPRCRVTRGHAFEDAAIATGGIARVEWSGG